MNNLQSIKRRLSEWNKQPNRTYKRMTEEEHREMVRLLTTTSIGYTAIGRRFGRDHTSILYWKNKLGIGKGTKPVEKIDQPVQPVKKTTYIPSIRPKGRATSAYKTYLAKVKRKPCAHISLFYFYCLDEKRIFGSERHISERIQCSHTHTERRRSCCGEVIEKYRDFATLTTR